jgi:hypothetical protein
MRKWYVPLTVAGLGGLGAFLFSESGKEVLRALRLYLQWHTEGLPEWNEVAEQELQRIQEALASLAESLEPRPEPSR